MCEDCCKEHKNICEHKWWSKRPEDKQLLLASDYRLLFGDVGSGESAQEKAEARDVEKLKTMYPFLTEHCRNDPDAIRRCTRQLVEHARIQNELMKYEPAYSRPNMHCCIHYWLSMMEATALDVKNEGQRLAQANPELAEKCKRQEELEMQRNRHRNRLRADDLRVWDRQCLNGSRSRTTFDETIQRREQDALLAVGADIEEDSNSESDNDGESSNDELNDGESVEESVEESAKESDNESVVQKRKKRKLRTSRKAKRKRRCKSLRRQCLRNIQQAVGKYHCNLNDTRVKHANSIKKKLRQEIDDFLDDVPNGKLVPDAATDADIEKISDQMFSLVTRQVNLRV